ncbi:hypothetical protein C8J56DRAFT_1103295 [Mycena floridula]|nr:hypothetical protein C8J56DRAFT_1103295 [Mycena floridula]
MSLLMTVVNRRITGAARPHFVLHSTQIYDREDNQRPVEPTQMSPATSHLFCTVSSSLVQELRLLGPPALTNDQMKLLQHKIRDAERFLESTPEQLGPFSLERRNCSLQLEQYRAVIAPIRRIPNEILNAIFLEVVDDPDISSVCLSDPPWSLSYVCHRWRSITLGLPELWSCVRYGADEQAGALVSSISILETFLSRSQGRLLDLEISDAHGGGSSLFNILLLHAKRFRMVELQIHDTQYEHFSTFFFPVMKKLQVDVLPLKDSQDFSPQSLECPKLVDLSVIVEYNSTLNKMSFPWHQLKSLSIWSQCPLSLTSIVRQTTAIQELTVHSLFVTKPIELPHLRSLHCAIGSTNMQNLTLPSLRHIILHETSCSALSGLLERSRCSIQSASTQGTVEPGLIPAFSLLRDISSLDFGRAVIVCDSQEPEEKAGILAVMTAMTRENVQKPDDLLPHLQSISVRTMDVMDYDDIDIVTVLPLFDSFWNMVHSRTKERAHTLHFEHRLKEFRINDFRGDPDELEKLRTAGVLVFESSR